MKIEEAIKQKKFNSEIEKLVVNLIYTGNWVIGINAKALKSLGLTTQQYNVMRILKGQHPKPAPVSLVNERMLDKMSNASRLIEKLRQKGLVDRTTCANDRRQVDVNLTEKGLALLKVANAAMKDAHSTIESLSNAEAKTLNDLLDKLRTTGSKFGYSSNTHTQTKTTKP